MKVFIVMKDGISLPRKCFTGLRAACNEAGISYWTAVRKWNGSYIGKAVTICQCEVIKQEGKSGNGKKG